MFFKYRVKWSYDDGVSVSYGIGKADNFKEAMVQITEAFGDQELWEVNIEWLSDDGLLDVEDLYEGYRCEERTDAPKSEIWEEVVEALNDAVMQCKDENEEA